MRHAPGMKLWTAIFVLGAVYAIANQPGSLAQDEKKPKGRLPPYFATIVTDEQRQRIYEIQAGYAKIRESLEAQLETIKNREMAEIESVLSPTQKLMLEKARADAAPRRKKSAEDKKLRELSGKLGELAPAAEPAKEPAAKKPKPAKGKPPG